MENENKIQVFEKEEFGKVRTLVIDGEPWAVGKDVAEALGYANPQKAIRDHVDPEDKTVNDSFTVNGTPLTLINESGLYSLILSSKLPNAKKFKRWVTSEVLPTLRRTGSYGYGKPSASVSELTALIETLRSVMTAQNSHPSEVAEMAKAICEQNGIALPDSFVSTHYLPTAPKSKSMDAQLTYVHDFVSMPKREFEEKYRIERK